MSAIFKRVEEALRSREQLRHTTRPPQETTPAAPATAPRYAATSLSASFAALHAQHRTAAFAFAVCVGTVILVGAIVRPPTYRAAALVTIVERDGQTRTEWDLLRDETRETDFEEQIRSQAVLEPVVKTLGLLPPASTPQALHRALSAFRQRLTVERLQHSGIVRIAVADSYPDLAADAANAVAQAWIDLRRSLVVESTQHRLAGVQDELEAIRHELELLDDARRSFAVSEASLQELGKQLAAVTGQLSHAVSRYADQSPPVVQLRREQDVLQTLLQERTEGRRRIIDDLLTRFPVTGTLASSQELQAGTLIALTTHAERRYQELLDEQAKARLAINVWGRSPKSFGNLAIIEDALTPPAAPGWLQALLTLAAACALSGLGFMLFPVLVNQWKRRSHGSGLILRAWLHELFTTPSPSSNGSSSHPSRPSNGNTPAHTAVADTARS